MRNELRSIASAAPSAANSGVPGSSTSIYAASSNFAPAPSTAEEIERWKAALWDASELAPEHLSQIKTMAMVGELQSAKEILHRYLRSGRKLSANGDFLLGALASMGRGMAIRFGEHFHSLRMYRSAAAKDPNHVPALLNVAAHWVDSTEDWRGWLQESQSSLRTVLEQDPSHALARYLYAHTYEVSGDNEKAAMHYWQLLERGVDHRGARLRLLHPHLYTVLSSSQQSKVDAPPSSIHPDRLDSADDSSQASETLNTWGVTVIRQCIDPERVEDLRRWVLPYLQEISAINVWGNWGLTNVHHDLPRKTHSLLKNSSFWSTFLEIIHRRQPGWSVREHRAAWMQRRCAEAGTSRMGFHQDHPVFASGSTFFTIWLPMVACGRGRAPSLQIAPADLNVPYRAPGSTGRARDTAQTAFIEQHIEARLVELSLEVGDLALFEPNILHRTSHSPQQTGIRTSVDLRFEAGPAAHGFGAIFP